MFRCPVGTPCVVISEAVRFYPRVFSASADLVALTTNRGDNSLVDENKTQSNLTDMAENIDASTHHLHHGTNEHTTLLFRP